MKQYYYINTAGQQTGPVSLEELTKLIGPSTLIWCESMENWQPANTVINIGAVPPPTPAAYAPGMPQPPFQNTAQTQVKPEKPDNYQIWAILALLLCCLPLGILALLESNKVNNEWDKGNYEAAKQASEKTKTYLLISAGAGILMYIIGFIMGIAGAL